MARTMANAATTSTRTREVSLSDFVQTRIREGINEGRFPPGSRIRETVVAEWLGVSRTPIRRALRQLESAGLLKYVPWRGVVVTEIDRQQVLELYAMRAALEGLAARLAARNATAFDIQSLEKLVSSAEQALNCPQEMARINVAFHRTIYGISENSYLIQELNALQDSLALLQGTTFSAPARATLAHAEHLSLLQAIRDRDEVEAEATARYHLEQAGRVRLKMMSP